MAKTNVRGNRPVQPGTEPGSENWGTTPGRALPSADSDTRPGGKVLRGVGVVSSAPARKTRRLRPVEVGSGEGFRPVPGARRGEGLAETPAERPAQLPVMTEPVVTPAGQGAKTRKLGSVEVRGRKSFTAQTPESTTREGRGVVIGMRGERPVGSGSLSGAEAAAANARDRAPLPGTERRRAAGLAKGVGIDAVASNKRAISATTPTPIRSRIVGATPAEQGRTGPTEPVPTPAKGAVSDLPVPGTTEAKNLPLPKGRTVKVRRKAAAKPVAGKPDKSGVDYVRGAKPDASVVEYGPGADPRLTDLENEADRQAAISLPRSEQTRSVAPKTSGDSHRKALEFYARHGAGAAVDLNEVEGIGEGGGTVNAPMSRPGSADKGIGWGADAARNALVTRISKGFTSDPKFLGHRASTANEHHPRVVALGHKLFSGMGSNPEAVSMFSSRVNTMARARKVTADTLTSAEYEGAAESVRAAGHIYTADVPSVRRSGGFDLANPGQMTLRGREGVPERLNTKKLMKDVIGGGSGAPQQTAAQQQKAALTQMDEADFARDDTPVSRTADEMTKHLDDVRDTPDVNEDETDEERESRESAAKRTNAKIAADMRNHPAAAAGRELVKRHRAGEITDEQLDMGLAKHKLDLLKTIPAPANAMTEQHFTEAFTPEGIAKKASRTVAASQDRYAMGVAERELAASRAAESTADRTHRIDSTTTDADGRVQANVERLRDRSGKLRISKQAFSKHVDVGHTVNIDGEEHTVTAVNKLNVHVVPHDAPGGASETSTHHVRMVEGVGVMAVPTAAHRSAVDDTRIGWESLASNQIAGHIAAQESSEKEQTRREGQRTDARPVAKEALRARVSGPTRPTPAPPTTFTDTQIREAAEAKKGEAREAIGIRGVNRPAATGAQGQKAFGGKGSVAKPGRTASFAQGTSK